MSEDLRPVHGRDQRGGVYHLTRDGDRTLCGHLVPHEWEQGTDERRLCSQCEEVS